VQEDCLYVARVSYHDHDFSLNSTHCSHDDGSGCKLMATRVSYCIIQAYRSRREWFEVLQNLTMAKRFASHALFKGSVLMNELLRVHGSEIL
jgi:hypothetical protein